MNEDSGEKPTTPIRRTGMTDQDPFDAVPMHVAGASNAIPRQDQTSGSPQ